MNAPISKLILCAILFLAAANARGEETEIKVYINGKLVEGKVIESDGSIYVPLDAVAKALGAQVTVATNQTQAAQPPPVESKKPVEPPTPVESPVAPPSQTVRTVTIAVAAPPPPVVAQMGPAIKGVLAWVHDIYKQHEPDAGAQVWLATQQDVESLAAAAGGNITDPIPKRAGGWDAKLTDQFHMPVVVADAHGLFFFNTVAAGEYVLILRSRHAKDTDARDRHGKIRFQRIVVRDGEMTDVSFNFGRTAYPEENE